MPLAKLGNETVLLKSEMKKLADIARSVGLKLAGRVMSLDGVYNSRSNRKAIFNLGMTPNIPENKRNRKKTKRGRKQIFCQRIFGEKILKRHSRIWGTQNIYDA